jgi:hypothetical protein
MTFEEGTVCYFSLLVTVSFCPPRTDRTNAGTVSSKSDFCRQFISDHEIPWGRESNSDGNEVPVGCHPFSGFANALVRSNRLAGSLTPLSLANRTA